MLIVVAVLRLTLRIEGCMLRRWEDEVEDSMELRRFDMRRRADELVVELDESQEIDGVDGNEVAGRKNFLDEEEFVGFIVK